MKRSRLIIIPLLVLLAGCMGGSKSEAGIQFLTLKGPSAMGMIHLIDSTSGLIPGPLSIEILDEPMMVRARVLKERPELAVLPLNMGAILYNKGLPYEVVGIPVWGTLYLFGYDHVMDDWASLKGKRVYLMGKGTTPDILFRYLLIHHGLTPDVDVMLDYSFPLHIDLANAVIAGKAPLAVISEPLVSMAKIRNEEIHELMDLNDEWAEAFPGQPEMPQTALLVRKDFIRDHPEWVRSICEAWNQSIIRVNRDPKEAAIKMVRYGILPDTTVAVRSIPGSHLKFGYAADNRPEIEQFLGVFFNFNPDAIGGKIPDEKFISEKPGH